jgi:alpha-galactosidase
MALNTLDTPAERYVKWSEIPHLEKGCESFQVTDVWTGKSLGCVKEGIKSVVESHDTVAYLVGKKCTKGWWA